MAEDERDAMIRDHAKWLIDAAVATADRNTLRDGVLQLRDLIAVQKVDLPREVWVQFHALVAFAEAMLSEPRRVP